MYDHWVTLSSPAKVLSCRLLPFWTLINFDGLLIREVTFEDKFSCGMCFFSPPAALRMYMLANLLDYRMRWWFGFAIEMWEAVL